MEKFKVLQNNRRFMSSILRIDVEQKTNPWMKSADNFFTSIPVLLILFILFSIVVSSAVRMQNNSYDFTARLTAALLFIAMFQAIIVLLNMGLNIQKIAALFATLQTIVDSEGIWALGFGLFAKNHCRTVFFDLLMKNKFIFFHSDGNNQFHGIYWRAEQKYRKYSKRIAVILLVYDQSTYLLTFLYSICWILTGNNDASTWPILFELSVPFDTKTIGGWYLLLMITACLDLSFLICVISATTQFIGCCIYMLAICEHFNLIMQTVQANIEENLDEENPQKFKETSRKANAGIWEAVQIHAMIYE